MTPIRLRRPACAAEVPADAPDARPVECPSCRAEGVRGGPRPGSAKRAGVIPTQVAIGAAVLATVAGVGLVLTFWPRPADRRDAPAVAERTPPAPKLEPKPAARPRRVAAEPPKPAPAPRRDSFPPPWPDGPAPEVLALEASPPEPADLGPFEAGLLARGLVRQAIPLAGREGLGLDTRDATLADALLGQVNRPVLAGVPFTAGKPIALSVARGGRSVGSFSFGVRRAGPGHDYAALSVLAEMASREVFPGWLAKAGFARAPNRLAPERDVPQSVRADLEALDLVAQFDVLRRVHAAMRLGGESPARLEVVAQAYGQLRDLTEPLWQPWSQVARALLSARRAAGRDDSGHRTRAFALALAGLPGPARDALRKAGKARASGRPEPSWLAPLRAYLAGDEVTQGTPPARLFRFLSLANDPRCAAQLSPERRDPAVRRDLPPEARAALPGSERGEPSLTALAGCLGEFELCMALHRNVLDREVYGLPPERAASALASAPFFQGNPMRPHLSALTFDPERAPRDFKSALERLDFPDADVRALTAVDALLAIDPKRGAERTRLALAHCDFVRDDLERLARRAREGGDAAESREAAGRLLDLDPESDLGRALAIQSDPDGKRVKPNLKAWGEQAGRRAAVSRALATRAFAAGDKPEAERLLRLSLKRSNDTDVYVRLAAMRLAAGDRPGYVADLKESLDGFDLGLARHYLAEGKPEEARPFAEKAAETRSGWGMICAADVLEELGEFEKSEMWVRRVSEQYDGSRADWYLWCLRTGRGDQDAARRHFFASYQGRLDRLTGREAYQLGLAHAIGGEPDKALDLLKEAFDKSPTSDAALALALAADEARRPQERDAVIGLLAGAPTPFDGFGKAWAKSLKGRKPPTEAECDRLLNALPEPLRDDYAYFVGKFLSLHGDAKTARKYLRQCARSPDANSFLRSLAKVALRDPA